MFCEFLFLLTKTLSRRANQKSKKLSCKPFSRQARNGFSLFSGCRGDSFLLFFFFSHCLNALSVRKSEKSVETSRICLFSLRKPLSVCKPGKSDKSEVANSVFSGHSSKAEKSNFFLRKSARNCPTAKVVRSRRSVKSKLSVYVKKKDSSSKIFQYKSVSFFLSNYAR